MEMHAVWHSCATIGFYRILAGTAFRTFFGVDTISTGNGPTGTPYIFTEV